MYRFSFNAIKYTIKQLFSFAGIVEEMTCEAHLEEEYPHITVTIAQKQIQFNLLREEEIQTFLDGKLSFTPQVGVCGVEIPFFGQTTTLEGIDNNTLIIYADIITPSFILLSRYEEWICKEHDAHGRFEYKNSLACKYNWIEIPLVDEYALWLRKTIQSFIPSLKINKRESTLIPTHDIDLLYRFGNNSCKNLRSILGGDFIKNRSLRMAISSWKEWKRTRQNKFNDPYIQAIAELCLTEQSLRLEPILFIKAQHLGEEDATYDIDDENIAQLLQNINGVTIGLHGSYPAAFQSNKLADEKQRLETVVGKPIQTIRQHFLRFDIHKTIENWAIAGLEHDYTLGFAEREGFRCGTCHPYPLYDHAHDCPTNIIEHPLIVMDGTLIEYRKLSVEKAYEQLHKLTQYCCAVEGDMVILWHNHTTSRQYKKYFEEGFKRAIR